jgi:hypothetical protein
VKLIDNIGQTAPVEREDCEFAREFGCLLQPRPPISEWSGMGRRGHGGMGTLWACTWEWGLGEEVEWVEWGLL